MSTNNSYQSDSSYLIEQLENIPVDKSVKQLLRKIAKNQTLLENKNRTLEQELKKLTQQQEYFSSIFNHQPAGVYRIRVLPISKWHTEAWLNSVNPPYILEHASDRCCDLLDISREEFANNPYIISDLVYGEDKVSFVKANQKANKKMAPFYWEGRLFIQNKIVWVQLESLPEKLRTGEIVWTGVIQNITERKNAEVAVNKSRLQLEDVLIGAKVGTLEWNVQTGEMNFNDILARNLGYTGIGLKKLAKKHGADLWKEFTHPEDIPYAGEMIMRHFSGEFPYHSIEVRMKHKKGHWVWIRQEGKVMTRTNDGQPLLMMGTHTDISNRKQMEEDLRRNEEKYRILFENNPQPMLIFNPSTLRIMEVNKAFVSHYGYTRDELLEMSIKKLRPAEQIPDMIRSVNKVKQGETNPGVKLHQKKNGEIIYVEIKTHKIHFNGEVAAHVLINDVTGRIFAENALYEANNKLEERIIERTSELLQLNASLRETEQKFKTANDFTSDWEYWKSPDNKIIFMSPSVEQITGYSIQEFEESPDLLDRIIHTSDTEIWENHKKERCVHSPDENAMELSFRIVKKDGDIRWIGHVCRCIHINGENLGVRVSNRDITDKVNADNALLGLTMEVEEHERNRLSRELHDSMGPLLSTIKLYFEWLIETDDAKKKIKIAEKGNLSIDAAIETARELSRGLSTQLLIKSGYNIAIRNFIQRINDTNKIDIRFSTNTSVRFAGFMETMLYRITTELIKNTLTYAEATSVSINLNFDRQKSLINFSYTDNGIGFDAESVLSSGNGLGIMNIQQRVQVLKGNFSLKANTGEGMHLYIQLPVENEL